MVFLFTSSNNTPPAVTNSSPALRPITVIFHHHQSKVANSRRTSFGHSPISEFRSHEKILVFITQMLILIGFLAIWEILANANIIDSFITSKPSRIFNTFMNLSQNDLLKHIWVTSYETIVRIFNWDFFGNIYCNFIMVV